MKITFIKPSMGSKPFSQYAEKYVMEPLELAVLAGLTPSDIEICMFDDRIEKIPYDKPTDLVAINTETFTAKRAYAISQAFRKRGSLVVLGGCHATLVPEEAKEHADSVVVGEAEDIWAQVISDTKNGRLKQFYRSTQRPSLIGIKPNREIFKGKRYINPTMVEFGRGCKFRCNFCAVGAIYNYTHNSRPVTEVVEEIKSLGKREISFVDDNIAANIEKAKELFKALIPLHIKWSAQISVNFVNDPNLMELMVQSGCKGVLIGLESLDTRNLKNLNKQSNIPFNQFEPALKVIRQNGIMVWGSFMLGCEYDTKETFETTLNFALKQKLFLANFNNLIAYPGTPLYDDLKTENRLLFNKWWLDPGFKFGNVAFKPKNISPDELTDGCHSLRLRFSSYPSILRRGLEWHANCKNIENAGSFFAYNLIFRREIRRKQDIILDYSN